MRVLKEAEFNSIKQYIDDNKPKNPAMFFLQTAKLMDRSIATISRIDASGDYGKYRSIIAAEHSSTHKRVPLAEQVLNARIEELIAIRSKGRFKAYKYVIQRIHELDI